MITWEVHGLKEMGKQLEALPAKLARRALAASVREGAAVIRVRARAEAPLGIKIYKDYRGRTHRPGFLRKSGVVMKKMKTRDWRSTVLFGLGFSKRGFYGKWVERGKAKKHKQSPNPFVLPAFEATAQQAVEKLKSRLGEELAKIIRESGGMSVK